MKLSERIRTEISKAGLVRWDDLADEVDSLETIINNLESFRDNFEEIELNNTVYLTGLERVLSMARYSLDMETTRYIVTLYDDQFDKGNI